MENPSANAEQRAGAAMALTPLRRHRDRERLRIAAESTSDTKLRVALDAAAQREALDAELAAALAEASEG